VPVVSKITSLTYCDASHAKIAISDAGEGDAARAARRWVWMKWYPNSAR